MPLVDKTMTHEDPVVILMAGAVCSCSRTQPASEAYPDHLIKDQDWIVYEGTLPVTNGADAHVELSLFPGVRGLDSRYRMMEYPDTSSTTGYRGWIDSRGRDFFEKNTQKQWSVAQLGAYDEAVRKYTYHSKEKFEGVYLKALAYTASPERRRRDRCACL